MARNLLRVWSAKPSSKAHLWLREAPQACVAVRHSSSYSKCNTTLTQRLLEVLVFEDKSVVSLLGHRVCDKRCG
ncbi:hypothetical protein GBAR_LOCUS24416, partial [Geodia barretti]